MIGVGNRNVDSLIDIILELTSPPLGVDLKTLRADIELWIDRYFLAGVADLDMNGIVTSGMGLLHDHRLVLPADLALLLRVLLNLQGLSLGLGTDVRVAGSCPTVSTRGASPDRWVGRSGAGEHFWAGLPGELQFVVEQLKAGKVGVDFRVHDADSSIDNLIDGLITVTAVVAGAQLVSRPPAL